MKTVIFISVIFFFAGLVLGDVINIPGDQTTIQAGINAADNGDTVLVAENTYYENINFKGKAITVASLFLMDRDTSHISKTIIDGSRPSHADSGSVVYFTAGTDTNSILTGFKITAGTGTFFTRPNLPLFHYGGGIFIDSNEGARIERNIIENNIVNSDHPAGGGGIYSGSPGGPGYTIIEKNIIRNNEVTGMNGNKEGCGIWMGNSGRIEDNIISSNSSLAVNERSIGAIRLWSGGDFPLSEVHVSGNTISDNQATSQKSWAAAGGLNSTGTVLYLVNNRVERNKLTSPVECLAAGVHVAFQPGTSKIEDNIINGNTMTISDDYDFKGGGLFLIKSENSISNNTITNNYAGYGAGIYLAESNPRIVNNYITNNNAGHSGGGIECYENCNPVITNNLIAFNEANEDAGGIDIFKNSNPMLINNTIVENTANLGGGMAVNKNCDPTIMNTILYGNNADSSGNQIFFWDDASEPTFLYSVVDGGKAGFGFASDEYAYSGVYKNCLESDPIFVDDDSTLHLSAASPCIDAGNPDTSALFLPETDLFGNPRIDDVIAVIDIGAHELVVTALESVEQIIPDQLILYQNYPNPFNPKTVISYQLSTTNNVKLSVYNIIGQMVALLVDKRHSAGKYKVEWDASGFASGIYFYRLETDKEIAQIRKLVVLK